jgi:outer membrane protein
MQLHPVSPADPRQWIDMAVASNPRIVAADNAALRGEELIDVEKSAYMPTVGVQVFNDQRKTEGSLFGGGSDIRQYGARVKLEVPLYDGGMTSSRVREAKNLYGKAVADSARTRRNVERETTEALNGLETAISRVAALKASRVAQEQVVAQLSQAYRAGVSPSVEYLDAERDLFLARAEYLRARYDYALDTLRLRHAVGLLAIEDLAELNRSLVPRVPAAGPGNGPAN